MNSRNILTISAIALLGLALVPSSTLAQQQQTLRQQLVGTWEVVSVETGNKQFVGTNPKGYFGFGGSGKYIFMWKKADRPKDAGRADGVVAGYGSWSVDETNKTVTLHTEGSMNPYAEGTDGKFTISINGDELRATSAQNSTNVFRRVRQ